MRSEPSDTSVTRAQALAWRLGRHLLDPVGDGDVDDVVRRLGAVQSGRAWAAELSVRVRRHRSGAGDVDRALADGRLIRTFAFRGATHLMTPQDAGVHLALRAASRMWELPSWQSYYGLSPADWPHLREAVRESLAAGPLTHDELGAALVARPRFAHLATALASDAVTLIKPLAWQGDLALGPSRDGAGTYQSLAGNPLWAGIPDLDDAGPRAVEAYFRTYGPATARHVHYWLGEGLGAGRRRITGWIAGLGDRLAQVDVDGEPELVLREDVDGLVAAAPTGAVRLLPGYDQWVLGPGTADPHVVPPARRAPVTRQANLVTAGGVVSGTWSLAKDVVAVDRFAEAGPVPDDLLDGEVARLATILERPLRCTVRTV